MAGTSVVEVLLTSLGVDAVPFRSEKDSYSHSYPSLALHRRLSLLADDVVVVELIL